YAEIGSTADAVQSLLTAGWVDGAPLLTLDELFRLFTLIELQRLIDAPRGLRKSELRERLAERDQQLPLQQWWPHSEERVCALRLMPLCDRLRLMFFGNLRQDWSTFVLADLGIHRYETVILDDAARGFRCRQDIDDYFNLFRCRE